MKTPFHHHPPLWWARGNGKAGPEMLHVLVQKEMELLGKVSPSQGRI